MTASVDIYRDEKNRVIRILLIGIKDMKGGVLILKRVVSELPFWPSGHGQ